MSPPGHLSCGFIGDESLLIRCAEFAISRGHTVRFIATASPAIRAWAADASLPVFDARSDYGSAFRSALDNGTVDCIFSVANLRRVPAEVINLATRGAFNFHDGPLPRYGGLHAPAWALIAGERTHGVTWHLMTGVLDAGDVVVQRMVDITDDDTSLTLNLKCFEAGAESFEDLLSALERDDVHHTVHALDRTTYHRRSDRLPAGGILDWNRPAHDLSAVIRALDFGPFRNPLGTAKVYGHSGVVIARAAHAGPSTRRLAPGTVFLEVNTIVVGTIDGELEITAFSSLDGVAMDAQAAAHELGVQSGDALPTIEPRLADRLTQIERDAAAHEDFWIDRLRQHEPLELPPVLLRDPTEAGGRRWSWGATVPAAAPSHASIDSRSAAIAAVCAWFGHTSARVEFDVGLQSGASDQRPAPRWVFDAVPLRVALESVPLETFATRIAAEIACVRAAGPPLRDLVARTPDLRHTQPSPATVILVDSISDVDVQADTLIAFAVDPHGNVRVGYDASVVDDGAMMEFGDQMAALLDSAASGATVERLSLLDAERATALRTLLSGPAIELEKDATIVSLLARQTSQTPDAIAVVADRSLTYQELARESDAVARAITADREGTSDPVGIHVARSADLLVAVIGVLKSGAAYVPLDPSYPAARLAHMVSDSGATLILTSAAFADRCPRQHARVMAIEDAIANVPPNIEPTGPDPTSLAYVIYTSGSTGTPKGVMVEHRNVVSFFAAMNRELGVAPKRWLAVTSLSFDISVLELLWPLTHGSTVILHADHVAPSRKPVEFSLFYFSADARDNGTDKYRLMMDGARFADTHGFAAIWTPERHFHEFGGIFPNPSVTSAALAAITERIGIRAGSVVLPLHHPVRIAEEWSVVDNLSNGRVSISFASGWRPDDFVLRPEGYADAKKRMLDGIDTVRRLWRGESIAFDGPNGTPVPVTIHPRPVQKELPFFITAAGSPDTFAAAGRSGGGVLTHLLGQTIDELRDKIATYREARREAGHSGPGHVALMVHTFVGENDEDVKNLVRAPMKAYLRTSVSLIEKHASAFPTFRKRADGTAPTLDFASLSDEDADALLEYSFERYFETSGLFGTIDRCRAVAERLGSIGVDELACLIDFGVNADVTLRHLVHLDEVRSAIATPPPPTISDLILDQNVTHLQCTPSQVLLLLADAPARTRLASLSALLVGGEAMPPSLAQSLREIGVRRIANMYGPTETTVWSTTHDVRANDDAAIPIGRAIANTTLEVVGPGGVLVPQGVAGELYIGGPGVTRGYLNRDDLTNERFVVRDHSGRMYRTGDWVRVDRHGNLLFLGRNDSQVKVRGYRIELGEVERAIGRHDIVTEAAVLVEGDAFDDRRLVAYVTTRAPLDNADVVLRAELRSILPAHMVPSRFVVIPAFPRTLNGKLDRRRLAEVVRRTTPAARDRASPRRVGRVVTPPSNGAVDSAGLINAIARIWDSVLGTEGIGHDENFFDVGGHSLLAVQVHHRVMQAIGRRFPITDLFRYSTVRTLATHLAGGTSANSNSAPSRGNERANARRHAMTRRQSSPDR